MEENGWQKGFSQNWELFGQLQRPSLASETAHAVNLPLHSLFSPGVLHFSSLFEFLVNQISVINIQCNKERSSVWSPPIINVQDCVAPSAYAKRATMPVCAVGL